MTFLIRQGSRVATATAVTAIILGAICVCIGVYEIIALPSELRTGTLMVGAILKLAGIGLGTMLSMCIAILTHCAVRAVQSKDEKA